MKTLPDILKKEGYQKIKFTVSKTQHLLLKARINGILGHFILDTGASNTCVGFEGVSFFQMIAGSSPTKAAGAGGTGMETLLSSHNQLTIGRWQVNDFSIVIFDLSHVNEALKHYKASSVHGIIGADVLLKGEAIIDYSNQWLYLKKAI
jgi:hypothetical protein